jgi:hypothetical protein
LHRCPTWEELEHVKRLFFEPHECAMQLHVPPADHVNNHEFCLHIWRPLDVDIPRPPSVMVGAAIPWHHQQTGGPTCLYRLNLTAAPKDQCRPMTTTESGIMVSVLLRDAVAPVAAGQLPVAVDKLELFKTEAFVAYPPARSFYNHAILSGGEFDPGMAALAITMSTTPGLATLWAWTIHCRSQELGRPYTLDDFANDFPDGPPTDEAASVIWDAQKGKAKSAFFPGDTDNLLDTVATWQPAKETADAE